MTGQAILPRSSGCRFHSRGRHGNACGTAALIPFRVGPTISYDGAPSGGIGHIASMIRGSTHKKGWVSPEGFMRQSSIRFARTSDLLLNYESSLPPEVAGMNLPAPCGL